MVLTWARVPEPQPATTNHVFGSALALQGGGGGGQLPETTSSSEAPGAALGALGASGAAATLSRCRCSVLPHGGRGEEEARPGCSVAHVPAGLWGRSQSMTGSGEPEYRLAAGPAAPQSSPKEGRGEPGNRQPATALLLCSITSESSLQATVPEGPCISQRDPGHRGLSLIPHAPGFPLHSPLSPAPRAGGRASGSHQIHRPCSHG